MSYLKLVRYKNLLIVAFTQVLLQYLILVPGLQNLGLQPVLQPLQFFFLCFVTVLITASGFVINDLYDLEIDRINKPDELIIGKKISIPAAWKLYWALTILGGILAFLVALEINQPLWFFIYPFAVFVLWVYSKYLKKLFLWGNLVVAGFCGGVSMILWLPESGVNFREFPGLKFTFLIILLYSAFAFLTNFLREVIMDLEDMEGDQVNKRKTLPLVIGVSPAKFVAVFLGILILALSLSILWSAPIFDQNLPAISIFLVFNFLLVGCIYQIFRAKEKRHFGQISSQIKLLMLLGLVFLFAL